MKMKSVLIILLLIFSTLFVIQPVFIKTASATGWWNGSYAYYIPITITGSYVSTTLTNFPVLVVINTTIGSLCDGGNSIRFVGTDNTTTYPYEIDFWNSSANSYVWVNLSTLTATTDTTFLMYYNYSGVADGQNDTAVWDSNYILVSHMNDGINSSTIKDSTINRNNGTKKGANEPILSVGMVGNAQYFDGTDDLITMANSTSLYPVQQHTLSVWTNLKVLPPAGKYPAIWMKFALASVNGYGLVYEGDLAGTQDQIGDGSTYRRSPAITNQKTNTWYDVGASYNGTAVASFINGTNFGTPITWNASVGLNTNGAIMGRHVSNGASYGYLNGTIDEFELQFTDIFTAYLNKIC